MRTPFLNSALLALHYLRCIIAGEVAGARQRLGRTGAASTRPARLMELSTTQNAETACRYEEAQNASRAHIARERGYLDVIKCELVQISRACLQQCARGLVSKFQGHHFGQAPEASDGNSAGQDKGAVA